MWLKSQGNLNEKKYRIICCGHAGSSHVDFVNWKNKLNHDVEILAVSLPARCERIKEPVVSDIHIMANEIAKQIKELPSLPTSIFGHSFGAVLAYELGLKLSCSEFTSLQSIIISACSLKKVKILDGIDINNANEVISTFVERGYLNDSHVRNKKLIDLVLPYLLSDILCKENWQMDPGTYLDVPIHTIAWKDDLLVNSNDVHLWKSKSKQLQHCTQFDMEGEHLTYLQQPDPFFKALNGILC